MLLLADSRILRKQSGMNLKADQQYIFDSLKKHYSSLETELLIEIAQNAALKSFVPGDVLMRTGQYFKSTMLLVRGRIKVYKESGDGSEFFMYYIEPGGACALSMICAARQEQSELMARVVEDTELILIPIQLMDTMMMKYRSWYYFVLETYRDRFEELLQLIDHTVFKALDERLEYYLKKQSVALKSSELKITHEEIANDLGTSRVVISRLLKSMEHEGKIRLNRGGVTIVHVV